MNKWLHALTTKFMLVMGAALIIVVSVLIVYEWRETRSTVEEQLLNKGRQLAISLSLTLQSITEQDIASGVVLPDGTSWDKNKLQADLFNDTLTLNPDSERVAQKRLADAEYAAKEATLFDGSTIPLWQYEQKYDSVYDRYTDYRWQDIIDSFTKDEDVIFALPIAYSDNPQYAGFIATHNTIYSLTGEESKDAWGEAGLLSQNYRANRVFNDPTGYNAAANTDTVDVLLQPYNRLINGKNVETWDVSYPLYINGEHWGGVRVAISKENAEAAISAERTTMVMQFVILILVVLIILFLLTQFIVGRKLRTIVTAAANLNSSEADLTYRLHVTGKDEIAQLSTEINRFIGHIQQLMADIRTKSSAVAEHAHQLSQGSHQSRGLSSKLSSSMGEMTIGAEEQASGAGEIAKSMQEMVASVNRIAASSSMVADSSKDMLLEAEQGSGRSELTAGQMDKLRAASASIAAIIGHLRERSSDIQEMADTIAVIASQTNLLALNAAIEAAHAGEQGSGFAVVAGEVRKLSQQASVNAEQIMETTRQFTNLTIEAVEAMNVGEQEVSQGLTMVGELKEAFRAIHEESSAVVQQIHEVSAAAEEMAAGSEEVSASINKMAQVAVQTSSRAAQSAADTALQDRIAEETLELASSVNELIEQLQQSIGRFKME